MNALIITAIILSFILIFMTVLEILIVKKYLIKSYLNKVVKHFIWGFIGLWVFICAINAMIYLVTILGDFMRTYILPDEYIVYWGDNIVWVALGVALIGTFICGSMYAFIINIGEYTFNKDEKAIHDIYVSKLKGLFKKWSIKKHESN